jgi:hypothetical protein
MPRIGYLIVALVVRLLAALGGVWSLVLLGAGAAWSGSHIVLFWALSLLSLFATLGLMFGAVTVALRKRSFTYVVFACGFVMTVLGSISVISNLAESTSASFSFVLVFFLLTITAPAFCAVMCLYDLRRMNQDRFANYG